MATQSQQILAAIEALAGNVGAIAKRVSALESTPAPTEAPKAAKVTTPAPSTSAKAGVKRNLDPVDVPTGDESLLFRVIASNAGGVLTNGSRAVPISVDTNGKERIARSLNADVIEALTDDVRAAIRQAMATVDKRAHIGAHRPVASDAS